QVRLELMAERVIVDGEDRLGILEQRIVLISGFQIQRDEAGDPVVAVNDIRGPSEFPYRFNNALAEEDRPLVVVLIELVFLVVEYRLAVEIVLVIDKIYLKFRVGN